MEFLWQGVLSITPQQLVMYVVGGLLIWLAIEKGFEPALLLPMGFGAILVNLPLSGVIDQAGAGGEVTHGIVQWLFQVGIEASEAMPILLFIGIGAMIDFGPLLADPRLFLCGAAAQAGIFLTVLLATVLGFDMKDAASIGIIGAADGPTSILVSQVLGSSYVGAIAVAAYSYMAMVPIIQPAAIKLVTTQNERAMAMPYAPGRVSRRLRILFPILVTVVSGLVAPASVALVGFLMLGNLIRESGVPLAAPSANTSGRPSTTTAEHVMRDMDGKIAAILDGGACGVGVESTVITLALERPRLLRPGGITLEQLRSVLGEVDVDRALYEKIGDDVKVSAPGMKYRHYAPKAPVTVVRGDPDKTAAYIAAHLGEQTGVMCFDEYRDCFPGCVVECFGSENDLGTQAREVFDRLRAFDDTGVQQIWAQCPSDEGLGLAVANRIKKAAGFSVVEV